MAQATNKDDTLPAGATLDAATPQDAQRNETLRGWKTKWDSMTRAEKEARTKDLTPDQLTQLYTMERSSHPSGETTIGASPEFSSKTFTNLLSPSGDPWLQEKEGVILGKLLKFMPTAGGTVGGWVGKGTGGAVGGAAGAYTGQPWMAPTGELAGGTLGATIGGSLGEASREGLEHLLGWDRFDNWTRERRWKEIRSAGVEQGAAQLAGEGLFKMMAPTLQRQIYKLYFAGGFEHGPDPFGPGYLESILPELNAAEKKAPVRSVEDLAHRIIEVKKDIGNDVDAAYLMPITQGNRQIPLGKASANTQPLLNAVDGVLGTPATGTTPGTGLYLNPDINAHEIREVNRVRTMALQPRTYEQMADWRIKINRKLSSFYQMNPGVKAITLELNPELAAEKEIADAIRDVTYPEMEAALNRVRIANGQPAMAPGTIAKMQEKRGALIALEDQIRGQLRGLKTGAKTEAGKNPLSRANISGFLTGAGKGGVSVHRAPSVLLGPNVLSAADVRAASAFGHTVPQKVMRGMTYAPKPVPGMPPIPLGLTAGKAATTYALTPDRRVTESPVDMLDRFFANVPVAGASPYGPQVYKNPQDLKAEADANKPSQPKQWKYQRTLSSGEVVVSDDQHDWFDQNSGQPYQGEYQ